MLFIMNNPNIEELIKRFHDKFHQTYSGQPRPLPEPLQWRLDFLYEEFAELEDAVTQEDIIKTYDALLDIMIVAAGTIHLMGLPINKGIEEVMHSNMTKEFTNKADGKFGTGIIKGKGYRPPQLETLCQEN